MWLFCIYSYKLSSLTIISYWLFLVKAFRNNNTNIMKQYINYLFHMIQLNNIISNEKFSYFQMKIFPVIINMIFKKEDFVSVYLSARQNMKININCTSSSDQKLTFRDMQFTYYKTIVHRIIVRYFLIKPFVIILCFHVATICNSFI